MFLILVCGNARAEIMDLSSTYNNLEIRIHGDLNKIEDQQYAQSYEILSTTPLDIQISKKVKDKTEYIRIYGASIGQVIGNQNLLEAMLELKEDFLVGNILILKDSIFIYTFETGEIKLLKGGVVVGEPNDPTLKSCLQQRRDFQNTGNEYENVNCGSPKMLGVLIEQTGSSQVADSIKINGNSIIGKNIKIENQESSMKINFNREVRIVGDEDKYKLFLESAGKVTCAGFVLNVDEDGPVNLDINGDSEELISQVDIYFKGKPLGNFKKNSFEESLFVVPCSSDISSYGRCGLIKQKQSKALSYNNLLEGQDPSYKAFLKDWLGTISFRETQLNSQKAYMVILDPSNYDIRVVSVKSITGETYSTLKRLVDKSGAIAGINGGFFGPTGQSRGLLIENNNQVTSFSDMGSLNSVFYIQEGKPRITSDTFFSNILQTEQEDIASALEAQELVFAGGPSGHFGGTSEYVYEGTSRAVICIGFDNRLKLIVAKNQALPNLARELSSECREAANLDGGGSTSLDYRSKGKYVSVQWEWGANTVTYDPSIDRGRQIANAILIFPKDMG